MNMCISTFIKLERNRFEHIDACKHAMSKGVQLTPRCKCLHSKRSGLAPFISYPFTWFCLKCLEQVKHILPQTVV